MLSTRIQSLILSLVVLVSGGVVFGVHASSFVDIRIVWLVLLFELVLSIGVFIFYMRGWFPWLIALFFGYTMGIIDASDILFGPPVDGGYEIAVLSVTVLTTIGFLAGMVAEFIRYIHDVIHHVIEPDE